MKKIKIQKLALRQDILRKLSMEYVVGGGLNPPSLSCGGTCRTCNGTTCEFAGCGTR